MAVHSKCLIPSVYPSAAKGVTGISGSQHPLQQLNGDGQWFETAAEVHARSLRVEEMLLDDIQQY
jgi:hypothetical protein